MSTIPRLLERTANRILLNLRQAVGIRSYDFLAYPSLDDAFTGGGTAMFSARSGRQFRSPTITRRRWGLSDEVQRGLTSAMYDPADYASASIPADSEMAFLRISEKTVAGVNLPEGPILVVPPPGFFASYRPSLTVSGTAPNVAATTTGLPPAGSMNFALPRYADSLSIDNLGNADIYVSFGAGQPETRVAFDSSRIFPDAVVSEVFVRGDNATSEFSIYFAVVSGAME